MNGLMIISEKKVGQDEINTVNARELHSFLEVESKFTDWFSRRVKDYGFEEDRDFCSVLSKSSVGRPTTDFFISLDMAKELSMVERNAKGREARKYFIECERKLRERSLDSYTAGTSKFDVLIAALQGMKELEEKQNRQLAIQAEQQKQLDSLSEKVNQTAGGTGYYSIVAYARKVGLRVSTETAKTLGKQAAKMSRKQGFDIGKVADERWGTIGTYHSSILERVFPKPL